jgi:hypothetical protein
LQERHKVAESFDKSVQMLKGYQDTRLQSLLGIKANQWSTTPYSDYATMLEELDSSDLASAYQEHYQKLVADEPGGDVAKEQSLRWQTTFVANVRRAVRAKLVASVADRRGRVDQMRYACADNLVARALLERTSRLVTEKEGSGSEGGGE